MSGWRHQLPVYSPLSPTALLAGASALTGAARSPLVTDPALALIRERYAPRAALLTDSGTTALTAALLGVVRRRPGAAAALPAFACYDVATAADGADVPVLLYDVDPHALTPDLAQLRGALRQGAAAIVVVHHYGYPVDLTEVNGLAEEAGAIVIEDAAQAVGATIRGRPAGTQASLAVLSFGRGKGVTGGGGGALLANDEAGAAIVEDVRELLDEAGPALPQLVALAAQLLLARPALYAVPVALPFLRLGHTIYREPRRLRAPTAVSGAVLAATWAEAERESEVRRRNAEALVRVVRQHPAFVSICVREDTRPGYLRLPVLVSPGARLAASMPKARRLGVMPSYPKALCDLAGFGTRCRNLGMAFNGARLLAARLCTLPTHSRLAALDLTRLADWIRAAGGDAP